MTPHERLTILQSGRSHTLRLSRGLQRAVDVPAGVTVLRLAVRPTAVLAGLVTPGHTDGDLLAVSNVGRAALSLRCDPFGCLTQAGSEVERLAAGDQAVLIRQAGAWRVVRAEDETQPVLKQAA